MTSDGYVLGHADGELDRLMKQGEYLGTLTEQVLRLAGLAEGMTVLDCGCGAGDVSLLAARIVGPSGRVLGVDRSEDALGLARRRAAALGYDHVTFRAGDVGALALDERVDAAIGRLVLMYFPDPAVALRHLATLVKPGGLLAFHEIALRDAKSIPPLQLFDLTIRRCADAFTRVGANPMLGYGLAQAFAAAGLPHPAMIGGARVDAGPQAMAFAQLTGITRTLLPAITNTGVATADEVGIDTLEQRLRDEAVAANATVVSPLFVGAWCRL